jgi:cell division protein FtsI/penicillin-binding protein 2
VVVKRGVLVALGIAVVVAIVGAVAWFGPWFDVDEPVRPGIDESDRSVQAADRFAEAWETGKLASVPFTTASGDVAAATTVITTALTPADDDRPSVVVTRAGRTAADPKRASATARVTWKLDGDRTWTYDTTFALVEQAGAWRVSWTPAVVAPDLAKGDVLRTTRVTAPRGQIVDVAGRSLVGQKGRVTVGIRKSRTPDPAGTARTVAALVGTDPEALVAKVAAAGPEDFIDVVTLERAAYDEIRAEIQPLPGTVFREEAPATDLPAGYARALLGTTGTASKELAAASKGRIVEGDVVGVSGLQAAQDVVLGGTPGLAVQAVATTAGARPRVLKEYPAVPGQPVKVTLDQKVQIAADAVMAGAPAPAALVAIRPSTGDVLAVANGPAGASGYDRALIGRYPPGSTFKVATTFGLLGKGLTPDTVVDCPATITVGKVFRNAEGEVLGSVPFREDFAHSCNTAFISKAKDITAQELTDAAALLGYRKLDLGVPVFGGSVPVATDPTEHAADMIGQGKVEGSPFAVALASASVAAGRSVQPRLIIDPAKPEPVLGSELPAGVVEQLRGLMRRVVTNGTGGAVAGLPGGDVYGKTGTAEFGTESPPKSHAWFTGYQGDVAFAVLVEGGGFGGAVAAPLVAQFLTRLAGP